MVVLRYMGVVVGKPMSVPVLMPPTPAPPVMLLPFIGMVMVMFVDMPKGEEPFAYSCADVDAARARITEEKSILPRTIAQRVSCGVPVEDSRERVRWWKAKREGLWSVRLRTRACEGGVSYSLSVFPSTRRLSPGQEMSAAGRAEQSRSSKRPRERRERTNDAFLGRCGGKPARELNGRPVSVDCQAPLGQIPPAARAPAHFSFRSGHFDAQA